MLKLMELTIGLFLLAMKDNREIIIKDTPDLLAQEAAGLFCEAADESADRRGHQIRQNETVRCDAVAG